MMNKLFIEASKDSPKVVFDPTTNIFEISGKSHPENVKEFFKPILEWLNNYLCEIKDRKDINIVFNLKYIYINSSSYKYIIILLKKMKEFHEAGIGIEFVWHYEDDDDDMKESGEELFEFSNIDLPYKFNPYTEA